jgi:hypothetical protein
MRGSKSILTVLFRRNIELINLLVTWNACILVIIIAFGPMSFLMAQIVVASGQAFLCLLCELALAISVFKILLVTQFDWVFSHDPDQLGYKVLATAIVLAFLPSAAICSYQTSKDTMMANSIAYLTDSIDYDTSFPLMLVYIIFWTILGVLTMIFALVYIPYYIKHHLSSQAVEIGEAAGHARKEVSIGRILLGFLGISIFLVFTIVIHNYDLGSDFPAQLYIGITSLNLMLGYFIQEPDVISFIKRCILNNSLFCKNFITKGSVRPTLFDQNHRRHRQGIIK